MGELEGNFPLWTGKLDCGCLPLTIQSNFRLFLWSQFGHEYLLVTIKIRSHILFKTAALKSVVKRKGFLLSKSKAALARVVTNEERSNEFWLAGEISRSMACSVLYGKQILICNSHVHRYSQRTVKMQTDIVFKMICKSVVSRSSVVSLIYNQFSKKSVISLKTSGSFALA